VANANRRRAPHHHQPRRRRQHAKLRIHQSPSFFHSFSEQCADFKLKLNSVKLNKITLHVMDVNNNKLKLAYFFCKLTIVTYKSFPHLQLICDRFVNYSLHPKHRTEGGAQLYSKQSHTHYMVQNKKNRKKQKKKEVTFLHRSSFSSTHLPES
jgi:hypothetical protein